MKNVRQHADAAREIARDGEFADAHLLRDFRPGKSTNAPQDDSFPAPRRKTVERRL